MQAKQRITTEGIGAFFNKLNTESIRPYLAACYCRLSDDDAQNGTSISIETQTKILSNFCRDRSIEVFDFCEEMLNRLISSILILMGTKVHTEQGTEQDITINY